MSKVKSIQEKKKEIYFEMKFKESLTQTKKSAIEYQLPIEYFVMQILKKYPWMHRYAIELKWKKLMQNFNGK